MTLGDTQEQIVYHSDGKQVQIMERTLLSRITDYIDGIGTNVGAIMCVYSDQQASVVWLVLIGVSSGIRW